MRCNRPDSLKRAAAPRGNYLVFRDNDRGIPVDLSIERRQLLRTAGNRYDYVVFSGLGHNNVERTFATVADWIRRLQAGGGSTVRIGFTMHRKSQPSTSGVALT